ncbi:MAG: tRNA lysidine(34) synthetase TilS [Syntrophorhabdales bacterium]|jgi:tRNA(Ile)-lysidine synthase
MDLDQAVRRTIRREGLIEAGDTVLAAVSGGIDSSTLLSVLTRIRQDLSFDLAVCHVNHQLRGEESARDEAFVKDMAGRLGLPFHVARVDVKAYAAGRGLSLQHAGRELRYRYFDELARTHGYRRCALGHNRDDQVETFLLRVVKGTGLNGLASIPIKRGRIVRPLLRSYRAEIADYARSRDIPYVEDSSNLKDAYERNFIRLNVVPLLERLNPRFREKVLLLLADIASVNARFDLDATRFLEGPDTTAAAGGDIHVDAAALAALHGEVRFRVVSRILGRLDPGFTALREHVFLVEKSLQSKRPNNSVLLRSGVRVMRVYGDLIFTRKAPSAPPVQDTFDIAAGRNDVRALDSVFEVSFEDRAGGPSPGAFPDDPRIALFDAGRCGRLLVRTFRPGDRFTPLGMDRPVKLKDFFISRKIPRDARRTIPLVCSDSAIIWVVGIRISDDYKVTPETKRIMRVRASQASPP